MTITAKCPGWCDRCGEKILPGEQIEWSRGQQPYHTACKGQRQARRPRYGRCRDCGVPGSVDDRGLGYSCGCACE